MLALELVILGFSVVSISTVVLRNGQQPSASVEFAGLAANVTTKSLTALCSSWKQIGFL